MGTPLDIHGERFGKLYAVCATGERRNRQVVWKLTCDCGETANAIVRDLRANRKTHCGCQTHRAPPLMDTETDEQAYAIAEQSEKLSQLGAALRRANAMVAHMKFKIR
jgi:hypothetical protein